MYTIITISDDVKIDFNIKNNLIEGIKAKHRLGMVLRTCFDEICTALLK